VQWRIAATAELALSAILGFIFLGSHSLFLDESVSANLATAPWHTFTDVVSHREANMGLYYLVLRGWVVFGHSEVALRSLSVVATVLALAVVIVIARDLFGQRAALIGGLLLAVDPLAMEFTQDARGYALAILLVSASSLLFLRGILRPSSRPWLTWSAYALVSALGAYANFWAALVPLSHAASLAFLPRVQINWRRLVPVALALLVLLIPLGLLIRATDSAGVNWAAGSSAGKVITRIRNAVPHAAIDLAVVVFVVLVVGAVLLSRRRPGIAAWYQRNWAWLFAGCWLIVPLASVVLLSVSYKPLLVIRYLSVCIPGAALLVGAAIDRWAGPIREGAGTIVRLVGRPVVGLALAALVLASAVGTGLWYHSSGLEDWRATLAGIAQRARPHDGVMFVAPYVRIPFEWYVVQQPALAAELRPVYLNINWGVKPLRFDRTVVMHQPVVARAAEGYTRIWLVLCQQQFTPQQLQATTGALHQDGFTAARTLSFPGVQVVEEVRSG
jgi:mannosyltransferase